MPTTRISSAPAGRHVCSWTRCGGSGRKARSSELDDRLREAADLRLRNPTLSLRELAARADPPATKAGMQRRLARLVELAGS